MIRNISQHDGVTKNLFIEFIGKLYISWFKKKILHIVFSIISNDEEYFLWNFLLFWCLKRNQRYRYSVEYRNIGFNIMLYKYFFTHIFCSLKIWIFKFYLYLICLCVHCTGDLADAVHRAENEEFVLECIGILGKHIICLFIYLFESTYLSIFLYISYKCLYVYIYLYPSF